MVLSYILKTKRIFLKRFAGSWAVTSNTNFIFLLFKKVGLLTIQKAIQVSYFKNLSSF